MKGLASRIKLNGSLRVRPIPGFILAALLLAVIAFFLQTSPLIRDVEQRFQSRYLLYSSFLKTPEAGAAPIIVILINDHSLPPDSPRSPINRKWLGTLVERISDHKPALIGLNLLLDRHLSHEGDQALAAAISEAGNVVLRSEPVYPALPLFARSALDHGTLRFRVDSSGAVQEVCQSVATCRSDHILHDRIIRHFDRKTEEGPSALGWLRIPFSAAHPTEAGKYLQTPVFFAHEIDRIPAGVMKDKIVLVGTGFPDLYPLYRTPLPGAEHFLQETELLAITVEAIFSETTIRDLPPAATVLILFGVLSILSLLIVRRSIITGVWFIVAAIPVLFIAAAIAFTSYQVAIPVVLPGSLMLLFLAVGSIQQTLQERFSRLMTELQLKQAKIDFLTNELHTHHLFNELSRLNVMIRRQPESARAYLVEFAELLRASLKYGDRPRVPVSVQLEYLTTFLQQQKIIHGDRFRFSMDTKSSWDNVQAPWHVFFPLVENAVKAVEGVLKEQPDQEVDILVSLIKEGSSLTLKVENPFTKDSKGPSAQKGLANLENRLKWAYPKGGYSLSGGPEGQIWVATLQLPLN